MLFFMYFVVLCSNFVFITADGSNDLVINFKAGKNCTMLSNHTFTDESKIKIDLHTNFHIDLGWLHVENSFALINETLQNSRFMYVDKSMAGIWKFTFYYFRNNIQFEEKTIIKEQYRGNDYTPARCSTTVDILNATAATVSDASKNDNKYLIIGAVAGASVLTLLAQAAYIVYLKAKAQRLIAHNNLSKKTTETPANDTARYCTNPVQKALKVATPVDDDDDDNEDIYEAPNMELAGRMPIQPPQPPAINTMPRTPRPDHNKRIGPPSMQSSPMHSPARSPVDNHPPTFPRPKQNDRDANLATRPPLPLPIPNQEVYEEMETDDNTYESPPVITIPPRLPMPPKKVPTGNLLDVKEDTLRGKRVNKPPVTPKPGQPRPIVHPQPNELEQALRRRNNTVEQSTPKTNELEQALRRRNNEGRTDPKTELETAMRRRNNVQQVPITTIPEPSRVHPNPRPPPVLKSKPRGPPMPQPMQEDVYYSEHQGSSDEEWTYEPLKPYNNYDPNIYNV